MGLPWVWNGEGGGECNFDVGVAHLEIQGNKVDTQVGIDGDEHFDNKNNYIVLFKIQT